MSERPSINSECNETPSLKSTLFFGFGALTDQMSHQAFQFLTFTYYYAVVGINIKTLAIAFILFAIWDSINDPLLGVISDRTKSRLGRRRFWILVGLLPFALINFLLFSVPNVSAGGKIAYMFIIILLYDLFYTIFSTNQTALFPEMFSDETQRGRANVYKNILTIVGILLGFVLPTVLISPLAPSENTPPEVIAQIPDMYLLTGVILSILVALFGFIFFKYGMKETYIRNVECEKPPSIMQSLKITLKNKTFIVFVIANLFTWFVFKLLTTIIPLYGIHVLGIGEGDMLLTAMLLVAFLAATAFFPVMEKIGLKVGMRNGFMISSLVWIIAIIPFAFLDNQPYIAIVCMLFVGFGLSGAMYYVDIIIANIIDEDELKTNQRREGSYYGVNALINRYSTILVFGVIAIVLSGYGWENYLIGAGLDYEGLRIGLKILMVGGTIVGNLLVLIFLKYFSLHGKKLEEVKQKLKEKNA